mgnify:CR=1 FL=1
MDQKLFVIEKFKDAEMDPTYFEKQIPLSEALLPRFLKPVLFFKDTDIGITKKKQGVKKIWGSKTIK